MIINNCKSSTKRLTFQLLLFYLGNQARPKLFDLNIVMPEVLYEEVVQVDGRVVLDRADCRLDKTSLRKVVGTTQEDLFVVRELDEEKLKADLEKIKAKGWKYLLR